MKPFRTLKADEIECRVSTVTEKGCSLLLYKDARADMILLDETVGTENWQRSHELINGNLFCNVSIKCDGEWITKQDVGKESYTEAEKGQASDAFKRACVNWGIGRELYTAPFIWVSNCTIVQKNGKPTTYDKFRVEYIEYDKNRRIVGLRICNAKNESVYELKEGKGTSMKSSKENISEAELRTQLLKKISNSKDPKTQKENMLKFYKVEDIKDMTQEQIKDALNHFKD